MAHYCICPKCGEKFDRDTIQAVKVSARRYGHATCYPDNTDFVPLVEKKKKPPKELTPEQKDLAALKEYIAQIYREKANWPLINKQIKKFYNENKFSYSGMLKSLIYFYDVKKNSIDKSNGGIGIIEYTYEQAYQYYLAIYMAQQNNEGTTLNVQVKEFSIKPPHQRGMKNALLNWMEEYENGEEE